MKSSVKQTILIVTVTGIAFLGILGSVTVLFKSPQYRATSPAHEHSVSTSAARPPVTSSSEPVAYDEKVLTEEVARACPASDLACFTKVLLALTERHGPGASLSVLQRLEEQKKISKAADHHRIAHEIGRTTAARFGISGRAFLLCPTSMNDDCRHGFFHYALGQAYAADNAARLTCGSLDRTYSANFIFDCYLGLGHGALIAQKYDLPKALAACDTLGITIGKDGCRQGAFMENRSASVKGTGLRDGFSRTDPLAPCNVMPDQYRYACFINHAGRLMEFFTNDVKKASHACLKAPDAYVPSCLQSIGLMVSNPSWQPLLARNTTANAEVTAWNLCLRFPRDHREPCVIGALDTVLSFDKFEVVRANTFCTTVDAAYRPACYQRLGFTLKTQVADPRLVRAKCATLTGAGAGACFQGAGEETSAHPALASNAPIAGAILQTDTENIFTNDEALYAYVKRLGLGATITHLHALVPRYGDCHMPAHKAGRFAYSIFSMETFRAIPGECHAGGFHGAVEAYFKERGAAHLINDVKVICRSELNAFNNHQCMHGIGHGLMAAANYELPEALETCNHLKDWQSSCWTGAFMENIVGGLSAHAGHAGHAMKYLNDDPHYPCTIVENKYKSSCYFLQASRMLQLFGTDLGRVGSACAEAPTEQRELCFDGMGREVGGLYRGRPAEAIQACGNAAEGEFRIGCLTGAVQDSFWDPSGQANALTFCRLLKVKTEKDACYETIFRRAPQILFSQREIQSFCNRTEAEYRGSCLKKPKVSL